MIPQTNETDARILIDEQLHAAGWNPADKSQVLTEFQISGYAPGVAEPGAHSAVLVTRDGDFLMAVGQADYVLLDSRGRPLAIIEAKRAWLVAMNLTRSRIGAWSRARSRWMLSA